MAASASPRILIRVPASAKRGDVIEIKALINHVMENGLHFTLDGKVIPRKIIHRFVCRYNGEVVIDCDWGTAIAANPFMSFFAVAADTGTFEFEWTDDDGTIYRQKAPILVA
jgi:sulfur-oxidizing protein SoxZ